MREKKYFIVIFLVAVIILLNLPPVAEWRVKAFSRDNLSPFQNMTSSISVKWNSFISYMKNPGRSGEEKKNLIEEVTVLRERVRSLEAAERENKELRKQLGFMNTTKRKMILCEVIARDEISGWWQMVTLNKGMEDGIADGMAVISINGVVGKTIQVSKRTSDVLLVTDPNCKAACKFSRTGVFGVMRGGGVSVKSGTGMEMLYAPAPFRMDYVSKEDDVWVHDEVVTSGLGGTFPEGLMIGHVSRVDMDSSGLYQRAEVVPAANLAQLRYVFVVLK